MEIQLRKLRREDLAEYEYWQLPVHKYHEFNGPYFRKSTTTEVATEMRRLAHEFESGNDNPLPEKMLIVNTGNELIGEVNWYWKSEETNWLEIGVVIFAEANWSKGIGYQALKLWIDDIFRRRPEIIRIGLTSWSGNEGMMRLARKLGMKQEACYRKARIVKGVYYDSVSFGLLREEWR